MTLILLTNSWFVWTILRRECCSQKRLEEQSQSNDFPELEPFKMAAEELIEYLPHIYHHKIDTEHEKSYQKVKTKTFADDNKNKCQIKRDHSSTHSSLSCDRHFVSESLPALPNIEWKRWQSFQKRKTHNVTHRNSSSNSGSSTVGPNELIENVLPQEIHI